MKTPLGRKLLSLFAVFFLFSTQPAVAEDSELQRLHLLLSAMNQELQATFQQLQMVETTRQALMSSTYALQQGLNPKSYDEIVADRERALRQNQALYEKELQLLSKAQEIEARMQPVLERISKLAASPASTP